MMLADIIFSGGAWGIAAAILAAVALVLLGWGYIHAAAAPRLRAVAGLVKACAIAALALCLLEPLESGSRPRPGANSFVLLTDKSQSMKIRNLDSQQTRGEQVRSQLIETNPWRTRLSQDFDVRRYVFDTRLRSVDDFETLDFEGPASALATSLETLARRFHGRPLAGVLMFSDGNATDLVDGAIDGTDLPPIYPVLPSEADSARDVNLTRITVSQTNFEDTPVTIRAEITASDYVGQTIQADLFDEAGRKLDTQFVDAADDGTPLYVRFQFRPEQPGISFYRVRVSAQAETRQFDDADTTREATLANNSRMVKVQRAKGPYRVLYIAGRPNWELKFLRRAIEEDERIELVVVVRMANREAKFDFRGRSGERNNALFRGFDNQDDEQAEQYDEPVLVRLGVRDADELSNGFPKAPEELFRYDAVIVDDLEATFFTADQRSLLHDFVSRRGGGFMMLGGQESFINGGYERTPIAELLPVYLERLPEPSVHSPYRLSLTREGWLEPWVRLRSVEEDERRRLSDMPSFDTVNNVRGVKPGAAVLAEVAGEDGVAYPALVAQRFGKGRAAALLIGDLWKWGLRREPDAEHDLPKAWRQVVRWMVAEVPRRIDVDTSKTPDDPHGPIRIKASIRDKEYLPLDNATVSVRITDPNGKTVQLAAEASDLQAGAYVAQYVPRQAGAYRARLVATDDQGKRIGEVDAGWTANPAADEFRELGTNRELLQRLARESGGEVIDDDALAGFVASLPNRRIPITEQWVHPIWHQPLVFLLVIGCLVAEWGLRRRKGLP